MGVIVVVTGRGGKSVPIVDFGSASVWRSVSGAVLGDEKKDAMTVVSSKKVDFSPCMVGALEMLLWVALAALKVGGVTAVEEEGAALIATG